MILEQRITKWVQIAPFLTNATNIDEAIIAGTIPPGQRNPYISLNTCGVFPLLLFGESVESENGTGGAGNKSNFKRGISNFQIHKIESSSFGNYKNQYVNMSYTLSGCVKTLDNGARISNFDCEGDEFNGHWKRESFTVNHIWYYSWKDFETPPKSDDLAIRHIAEETARVIRNGNTGVISCVAGRGRSGTFGAIVVGLLKGNVSSLRDLVQIVVTMRENRDGLVETPQHFRFVARVLGLADPAIQKTFSLSSFSPYMRRSFVNLNIEANFLAFVFRKETTTGEDH
jgi:hypothetical protein